MRAIESNGDVEAGDDGGDGGLSTLPSDELSLDAQFAVLEILQTKALEIELNLWGEQSGGEWQEQRPALRSRGYKPPTWTGPGGATCRAAACLAWRVLRTVHPHQQTIT
jgi:hypothetical protein